MIVVFGLNAGHFKTATLLRYIADNNLLVYADNYLLAEIHEALIISFSFINGAADKIIQLISPFFINAPRNILGSPLVQKIIICMISAYRTTVAI